MTPMRSMATTALVGVALLLAGCGQEHPIPVPRQANAPCADLAGAGFPVLQPELKAPFFVCHKGVMALEFNPTTKTALWSVEHLTAAQVNGQHPIIPDFRVDPKLPNSIRNQPSDFTLKGYLPGQLTPAGDFRSNDVKMSWTFYLSNAVPMPEANRNGIWRRLEENVQAWAKANGELYVVSGPIFYAGQPAAWIGGPPPPSGPLQPRYATPRPQDAHKGKMGVPTHIFKAIYDPIHHTAVAFILPNTEVIPAAQLPYYAVPVSKVEALTYLTLWPNLPQHDQIMNTVDPRHWILH